jgi:tryptophan synthase beta chain
MACNMRTDLLAGHLIGKRRIGDASVVRAVLVDRKTIVKNIPGSSNLIIRTLTKPQVETVERDVSKGRFGRFGGKYVPESLMTCMGELEAEFNSALRDTEFQVSFPKITACFKSEVEIQNVKHGDHARIQDF